MVLRSVPINSVALSSMALDTERPMSEEWGAMGVGEESGQRKEKATTSEAVRVFHRWEGRAVMRSWVFPLDVRF